MTGGKNLRRLKLGLQTLFGLRKQGYFIPYRYADKAPIAPPKLCYHNIDAQMKKSQTAFASMIKRSAKHLPRFIAFDSHEGSAPRLSQDWFPRLDAVMAYSMVAQEKPARIIEVGSGHSTRFMRRAISDFNIACDFTAIDPSPRAKIAEDTRHYADYLQNMPLSLFKKLQGGDILFIDSSHILMPGSDVDFYLNGILPLLPKGVFVHIHDIFLPLDYPASWHWRGYNEQIGVAALLNGEGAEGSEGWKILWASAYALQNCRSVLKNSGLLKLPLPAGARESSLWLQKL